MTRNEILRRFPNACESFIRANLTSESATQSTEPERVVQHEPLAKEKRKDQDAPSYTVSIVSFRNRLLDPDNLCAKYFVDAIRYSGLIPDDSARDIRFSISQEKVENEMDERTEILIKKNQS